MLGRSVAVIITQPFDIKEQWCNEYDEHEAGKWVKITGVDGS
jgi:hypothetical protein